MLNSVLMEQVRFELEKEITVKQKSKGVRLIQVATEIGKLCASKNDAYGDSFAQTGEIMKILYPESIKPSQYADALAIVRILDKLFRIATRKHAFGESPFKDIAGYGILGCVTDEGVDDASTD